MTELEKIQRAVEQAAGKPAFHVESAPVVETFRGQTVWAGTVETFVVGEGFAYGWAVEAKPESQYVAFLCQGPINSAVAAVRAWIVSQARK